MLSEAAHRRIRFEHADAVRRLRETAWDDDPWCRVDAGYQSISALLKECVAAEMSSARLDEILADQVESWQNSLGASADEKRRLLDRLDAEFFHRPMAAARTRTLWAPDDPESRSSKSGATIQVMPGELRARFDFTKEEERRRAIAEVKASFHCTLKQLGVAIGRTYKTGAINDKFICAWMRDRAKNAAKGQSRRVVNIERFLSQPPARLPLGLVGEF